jgi:cytochrome c oxidase subunit I+III
MNDSQIREFKKTWSSVPGTRGWFMEVNNQPLGKRFMATAFVFFALGGILALLMRVQLAAGDLELIGPQRFNQFFTMHGSTMMYLFSVPFLEGLALYLLPLMIGSRDAAFPRLTAFSYWAYLFGGVLFYSSFFVGAVPDAGWFAYTPLSGPRYSGLGVDFWLLGLSLVEVAGIAAGVEIVVTVLKFRAPGMTISRMPLLIWTLLVVGIMILIAFTVLLMATLLLELDRAVGTRFFDPSAGGSTLLWQHLFWFFGHPEVYIMFLPATGIVSMVVATFARRKVTAYRLVVVAIVLIGFVSFGLWVHHMFVTGLPELAMGFFTASSLMIGIASGIQIFSWIATLWGTSPRLQPAFLWIIGFIVVFVLGGLTGVMVAVVPFDMQVHDTYFIVAHFHYVLIGGVVFPIFAGLHFWLPKITGKMMSERLGRWSFWLTFTGFNVAFFPMHVMGLMGLPRRVYTYPQALGLDSMNLAATGGAFVMAAGFILMVWNVWITNKHGADAGNDPWNGETLEWSVTSPPPNYGYARPPLVLDRSPMWCKPVEDSHALPEVVAISNALHYAPSRWRATLVTDAFTAVPQAIQFLPGPTLLPLMAALGLLVAMLGLLTKLYLLAPLGLTFMIGAIVYWLKPERKLQEMICGDPVATTSGLPTACHGTASTAWWGMLCFVIVLGVAFGTLVFCYFYLMLFSEKWPPQGLLLPGLKLAVPAFVILLAAASSGILTSWATKSLNPRLSKWLAGMACVSGMSFLIIWISELSQLPFRPDAHAYGSIFYTLGGALIPVTLVGIAMTVASSVKLWRNSKPDDPVVWLGTQLSSLMWMLIGGCGSVVFFTLYLSPRIL